MRLLSTLLAAGFFSHPAPSNSFRRQLILFRPFSFLKGVIQPRNYDPADKPINKRPYRADNRAQKRCCVTDVQRGDHFHKRFPPIKQLRHRPDEKDVNRTGNAKSESEREYIQALFPSHLLPPSQNQLAELPAGCQRRPVLFAIVSPMLHAPEQTHKTPRLISIAKKPRFSRRHSPCPVGFFPLRARACRRQRNSPL